MSRRNHVSPLVIVEAGLCFGGVTLWWLVGVSALAGAVVGSGTFPADVAEPVLLGGAGLAGVVLLAHAATHGVRGARRWALLVACVACGFLALHRADPPLLRARFEPFDIWFVWLPTLATLHLLLVAMHRSQTPRPAATATARDPGDAAR